METAQQPIISAVIILTYPRASADSCRARLAQTSRCPDSQACPAASGAMPINIDLCTFSPSTMLPCLRREDAVAQRLGLELSHSNGGKPMAWAGPEPVYLCQPNLRGVSSFRLARPINEYSVPPAVSPLSGQITPLRSHLYTSYFVLLRGNRLEIEAYVVLTPCGQTAEAVQIQ